MDASLRTTVILAEQARRTSSNVNKTFKATDSLDHVRLDRLPPEILLNIFSHLLDHGKFFEKTCIKYARTAHVKNSIHMISNETINLRNATILCRNMMSLAQGLLFHTICIDDQRRGSSRYTSISSMIGMILNGYPSGLLPFSQSKLFRFIRLLINTPCLRLYVKQLHISLPACHYSNELEGAINELENEVASTLGYLRLHRSGPKRTGILVPAKAHFRPFSQLKTLFERWKPQRESEVAMSTQQLCVWLKALLMLLPNLQTLRLWDIHSGPTEHEPWNYVRRVTEPLPHLVKVCLSSPLTAFETLRYISIPVYGLSGALILWNLPNVKTVEFSIFRDRASPEVLPSNIEKISHVDNLRFRFSDLYTHPDEILYAMVCLVSLFENVRSVEVYDGIIEGDYGPFYNAWLLGIFSALTPALMPYRNTLETLCYVGQFSYSEDYHCSFPDLSAFHQLKTLDIPQQLVVGRQRTLMNQPPIVEPFWTFSRLKLNYLPPNQELLTLDRCSGVILEYLEVLVENEDKFPGLHQVDVIFNCREGMEMLAGQIDQDGHWKGAEGSKIKLRPIKDYW
ncbi:hypothetical protein SLS60_009792 [Paraconiothyrium brasiliense]|uniref:F-box domain-containing protein n=1 Tax=Paraconiothyrium brasiliense TaxID=300254 RepID=A0ABR3QSH8_9PLEO